MTRYITLVRANLRSRFPEARITSLQQKKKRGQLIVYCCVTNENADLKAIESYLWNERAWDDICVYGKIGRLERLQGLEP
jgi:hypothetical protein